MLLNSILLICLSAGGILFLMTRSRRVMAWVSAVMFAFSAVVGFSLYTLGYLSTGASFEDVLSAAFHSLFSTGRMFLFNEDYGYLASNPHAQFITAHVGVQALFWLCHVMASFVIVSVAITAFGQKLVNQVRIWSNAHIPMRKNQCHYIITGHGRYANVFLENLNKNRVRRITIVTGCDMEDEADDVRRWIKDGIAVINGDANETTLVKAGVNKDTRRVNVIALSQIDEQNLEVAVIAAKKIENGYVQLRAYIMYSAIERTEHFVFAENAFGRVNFFNPYELKIRDFFSRHPITSFIPQLIDISKARLKGEWRNGKILKPNDKEYCIKNIFVGFGGFNSHMLKGSLLTGQLLGCDYNAVVYDEAIPSINQGSFMKNTWGLFSSDETLKGVEYLESPKEKYNIEFKKGNVLTKDFYNDLLQETIDNDFTILYVSLGNGKFSIETACEIRQHLYTNGITAEQVRIFVELSEQSVLSEDSVINHKNSVPIPIECFGFDKTVMTDKIITGQVLDEFAHKVMNRSHGTSWELLTETKRESSRQAALAVAVKLNLLGFKTDEAINSKVYYKRYLKDASPKVVEIVERAKKFAALKLVNEDTNKAREAEIKSHAIDYLQTDDDIIGGAISDTPRNNLARLEHLRWNTFHLVNGWTKLPICQISSNKRQDNLTKQHACITTFEELIRLRKLQAKDAPSEATEADYDTICYDYVLMDELAMHLMQA